jgi:hypothetical protein
VHGHGLLGISRGTSAAELHFCSWKSWFRSLSCSLVLSLSPSRLLSRSCPPPPGNASRVHETPTRLRPTHRRPSAHTTSPHDTSIATMGPFVCWFVIISGLQTLVKITQLPCRPREALLIISSMAPSSSPPRRASPGARESRFCSSFRRVMMPQGTGSRRVCAPRRWPPSRSHPGNLGCRLQGSRPSYCRVPARPSLARCAGDRGGASF